MSPDRTDAPDSTGDVPFTCPNCDVRGTMDEDQGRGEQSIVCPECGWHGRIRPDGTFEVGDEGAPDMRGAHSFTGPAEGPVAIDARSVGEVLDQIDQAINEGQERGATP